MFIQWQGHAGVDPERVQWHGLNCTKLGQWQQQIASLFLPPLLASGEHSGIDCWQGVRPERGNLPATATVPCQAWHSIQLIYTPRVPRQVEDTEKPRRDSVTSITCWLRHGETPEVLLSHSSCSGEQLCRCQAQLGAAAALVLGGFLFLSLFPSQSSFPLVFPAGLGPPVELFPQPQ